MNDKPSSDDRYTVPGLARGLQLLMQFNRDERELSGAELSRRLGLPRASVFRMLFTLEQSGFLERCPDGVSYKLGLAVLRLGFELLSSMELTEVGRPVIESLRDQSGFSAHLVVRDAREVVFIAKAAGGNAMFHSIQVGARLPAHATVLGRTLLSDVDMKDLAALYPEKTLPAYTPKTPTNLHDLKVLIDQDRDKGYGVSMGGYETGISTIAAPVFDGQGRVTAAISISVPSQRIEDDALMPLVELVKTASSQLTERLSHLPQRSVTPAKTKDKRST
ncbi:IclR family transcriptional regulator [Limnohabitans sp. G3-2]|uniref:IclR family transcriptional regulator n=1 Tax=Limnohabitans sp. G3-2 TaxID=1100711 RepID=UPI000C1F42C4|nr:IclR family transcriptional regulator [Limnohabitans sp. G3-2]PIT74905.1 IclR family transcriptional regulator [Limnohabitans sp. G3-2]